jgi:hypothetical protein
MLGGGPYPGPPPPPPAPGPPGPAAVPLAPSVYRLYTEPRGDRDAICTHCGRKACATPWCDQMAFGRCWRRIWAEEQQRLVEERAAASDGIIVMLLGTQDESCPLHVLSGHGDELRKIFWHLRRPSLPHLLSLEIAAGHSLFRAPVPAWLSALETETDWSPARSWVRVQRDGGDGCECVRALCTHGFWRRRPEPWFGAEFPNTLPPLTSSSATGSGQT